MRYRTYLFDMDGTVLDTAADLADAVNRTLAVHGFPGRSLAQVTAALGNGAARLMAASLPRGSDTPGFTDILAWYKAWYRDHSCIKTAPYPGMAELLAALRRSGAAVAIVSNKPHAAAAALGARFFPGTAVWGESPERPRKPAPDMVLHALEQLGADREGAVCIGDSEVDVQMAKNAGLPLIAVDWGFRTAEQLRAAGAAVVVHTPAELRSACGLQGGGEPEFPA